MGFWMRFLKNFNKKQALTKMILTKLFGTKSDREIKKLRPTLEKIKQFYGSLKDKSDDELRDQSERLR